MNKHILDIREFCLCELNYMTYGFLNETYVPIHARTFVWKVLLCNKILNLVNTDSNKYIEELEKSNSHMLLERRYEIWDVVIPICEKLKEYSALNFKPTDVYLNMSNNGYIKKEIFNMLKESGVHSWTSYISPITEKFWVQGDFSFFEFIERIDKSCILKEWWDFHQAKHMVDI